MKPDPLAAFEAGAVDPRCFHHRDHVRIGYELLERYRFPEALLHLARGLRKLAARAGHPEAYHETVTAAFLALIAERRFAGDYRDGEDFLQRNPELLEKNLLQNWYAPEILQSKVARETFLLPR